MIDQERLKSANVILSSFMKGYGISLVLRNNRIAVRWHQSWDGKWVSKTWITRGDSDYPTWTHPWGGTMSVALSMIIRWVRGFPTVGMSAWEYWGSDTVRLFKNYETLWALRQAGWPEKNICILCGNETKGLDWWSGDRPEHCGPCCTLGECFNVRQCKTIDEVTYYKKEKR